MSGEKKFHVGIKALVQNEEGKILLLQVNPSELHHNEHGIYWDLPGGRIRQGDSPESTLRKELKEEIGYAGEIEIIKQLHGGISRIEIPVEGERYGLVLFVYLCRIIVNPEKNPDIVSGFTYSSQGNNILFVSL